MILIGSFVTLESTMSVGGIELARLGHGQCTIDLLSECLGLRFEQTGIDSYGAQTLAGTVWIFHCRSRRLEVTWSDMESASYGTAEDAPKVLEIVKKIFFQLS